ncbi:DUF2806 domain-containing protein [Neorhizobium petrolearium]|uniref:DUF2806 domain-containing protein n=1 Tax=Neorhizobium petrolearium TaxID=515361 RepID=UPI003F80D356
MNDDQLPTTSSGFGISDLAGFGKIATALIGPITQGIGKLLQPGQYRREQQAQIDKFGAWDIALKARGYDVKTVDLTLAERAEVKMHAEAIVAQQNRESVAAAAIEHVETGRIADIGELPPPDDDWLDRFWRIAERIGNDDMQKFFGMILARRATGQAIVSARALEFLALLSGEEARALERIASFSLSIVDSQQSNTGVLNIMSVNGRYGSAKTPTETSKALTMWVQPLHRDLFGSLGIFVESGWAHGFYFHRSGPGHFRFSVANRTFELDASTEHLNDEGSFSLGSGVGLSPLGQEIINIIRPPADERYVDLLLAGLRERGLQPVEVTSAPKPL